MNFKKPKFWDLQKPNTLSLILLPFTIIIKINNLLLNLKRKKSNLNIKTICVGNIYIGGTGKTPSTIKLYDILKNNNFKVSTGKKKYKKYIDEEILLGKKTKLILEIDRLKVLNSAIKENYDIVVFDDGLQDKKISYNLQIVCFDAEKWIGNGLLIPAGPLRENIDSLKKYNYIFIKVNKKNLKYEDIEIAIKKINPNIRIFYTYYEPSNIKSLNTNSKYLIFSGIGNAENFKKILLDNKINVIKEIIYPDHYEYDENDIKKLRKQAENLGSSLLTTEKDFVKISKISNDKINFLEVDLKIQNEEEFTKFLKDKINE